MKTIAVIAELNPCHNGHAWLFEEARRLSGADCLIVLMSGDFVQRGEPAVFDKYIRTEMALLSGADLVLELPAAASTGSARRFAEGAAALLDRLGAVDELWFGSEAGDPELFLRLSGILAEEPDAYRFLLQEQLSRGVPFAAARETSLAAYLGSSGMLADQLSKEETGRLLSLLRSPNNTLGLEYCLALRRLHSSIRVRTLPRRGFAHDAESLSPDGFSSASSLRRRLSEADLEHSACDSLYDQVPDILHPLYRRLIGKECCLTADDFSDMLRYALWKENAETLSGFLDVSQGLANRIEQRRPEFSSFSSFASLLKTRDRSLAYIRRALLHILLGIRQEDAVLLTDPACVRLLGRTAAAEPLFSAIKKNGRLALISGGAALNDAFYTADLFASHLYESVRSRRMSEPFRTEFSRSVLMPEQR